jgi:hypothetical protein
MEQMLLPKWKFLGSDTTSLKADKSGMASFAGAVTGTDTSFTINFNLAYAALSSLVKRLTIESQIDTNWNLVYATVTPIRNDDTIEYLTGYGIDNSSVSHNSMSGKIF